MKVIKIRNKATLCLLLLLCSVGLAQSSVYQASDQSFSVTLPSAFASAGSPPDNTVLAVEVPNSGVSLFCTKGEAVELDPSVFADQMKRNLYDGGAQIYGNAQATLGQAPASSFLVGGVAPGKESLFVFNQRSDSVYTFVLNYPVGQRETAAKLWDAIAPSFKFRPPAK